MRTVPTIGLVLALTAGFVSTPSHESLACGNGVELEIERAASAVAQAENTTNRGFHADALKLLAFMFPNGQPRSDFLGQRAQLVAARAIARTGGRVGLLGIEAKEGGELSNLHLAGRFVQERLEKKPDDPALRTDYAEVLAAIPEKQSEARRILVELERKDLMGSAFGYAALARLRSTPRTAKTGKELPSWLAAPLETLDRAPREVDVARCERMALEDGVCARETKSRPRETLGAKSPGSKPAPPAPPKPAGSSRGDKLPPALSD